MLLQLVLRATDFVNQIMFPYVIIKKIIFRRIFEIEYFLRCMGKHLSFSTMFSEGDNFATSCLLIWRTKSS